jgi:hypothetical protein
VKARKKAGRCGLFECERSPTETKRGAHCRLGCEFFRPALPSTPLNHISSPANPRASQPRCISAFGRSASCLKLAAFGDAVLIEASRGGGEHELWRTFTISVGRNSCLPLFNGPWVYELPAPHAFHPLGSHRRIFKSQTGIEVNISYPVASGDVSPVAGALGSVCR